MTRSARKYSAASPRAARPITYPLREFYERAGRPLPQVTEIPGDAVPEPYRSLLVHHDDMTPTLERFHGRDIHIDVLSRERDGEIYLREVVLLLDGTEQSVEFGAIKIDLALFPMTARDLILKERLPLGHILRECTVAHSSEPKAFLRVEADSFIQDAFGLKGPATLYGRRNTLLDPQGRPLAEIVEILPPTKLPGDRR
jgi:chorismate-pyruvate lyase